MARHWLFGALQEPSQVCTQRLRTQTSSCWQSEFRVQVPPSAVVPMLSHASGALFSREHFWPSGQPHCGDTLQVPPPGGWGQPPEPPPPVEAEQAASHTIAIAVVTARTTFRLAPLFIAVSLGRCISRRAFLAPTLFTGGLPGLTCSSGCPASRTRTRRRTCSTRTPGCTPGSPRRRTCTLPRSTTGRSGKRPPTRTLRSCCGRSAR